MKSYESDFIPGMDWMHRQYMMVRTIPSKSICSYQYSYDYLDTDRTICGS